MLKKTKRAWDLYNTLMAAPDKWWTQEEIVEWVEGYTFYPYRSNGTDKAPEIREDVLFLNSEVEFDKIVVVNRYRYKIATREEVKTYMRKRLKRLKSQVKQIKALEYKMRRDGHSDILNNKWWETYWND